MSKKPELRGRAARLARLLPQGPTQAARTPFVLLVVLLLGGGLITLLILNSSLNEGSFQLSELKKETKELTEEEQELQRDVDGYAAPDALQRRARELGMVPGGDPAFLNPDGTVRGVPGVAARPSSLRQPAPRPQEVASPAPAVSAAEPPPAAPRTPASVTSASATPASATPAARPTAQPARTPAAPQRATAQPMKPGPTTTSGR
ncbi:septum formation initiator family protein [Streptomyces sp. NPDC041068]|uniref:septum formation initiator family protein n=1 Tax=Streptomyces sp. NPDC041068 TaxID=3155130 RepID=UPI0033F17F8C